MYIPQSMIHVPPTHSILLHTRAVAYACGLCLGHQLFLRTHALCVRDRNRVCSSASLPAVKSATEKRRPPPALSHMVSSAESRFANLELGLQNGVPGNFGKHYYIISEGEVEVEAQCQEPGMPPAHKTIRGAYGVSPSHAH